MIALLTVYKVRLVFPLYQYLGRCPFKQNFLTPEKHAYPETLNIPPPNLFLGGVIFQRQMSGSLLSYVSELYFEKI